MQNDERIEGAELYGVGGGKMITLESFSAENRDRCIGNSLYRICNTEPKNGNGKWYIYEFYNDGSIWSGASDDFISNDLQAVIDRINSFKKEREIVSIVFES